MSSDHKVAAVAGPVDYSLFAPAASLPVIDEDAAFEQCQEWGFIVELLNDILAEEEARVEELQSALDAADHTKFHKAAHAIKGAALNLHLPALVDVSKKSELLGKQLEVSAADNTLLQCRQPLIAALQAEYGRLEQYIPEAQLKADAELEGGGADGADGAYGEQQDEYDDYQAHAAVKQKLSSPAPAHEQQPSGKQTAQSATAAPSPASVASVPTASPLLASTASYSAAPASSAATCSPSSSTSAPASTTASTGTTSSSSSTPPATEAVTDTATATATAAAAGGGAEPPKLCLVLDHSAFAASELGHVQGQLDRATSRDVERELTAALTALGSASKQLPSAATLAHRTVEECTAASSSARQFSAALAAKAKSNMSARRARLLMSEQRLRSLRRQLNDELSVEWGEQAGRHHAQVNAVLAQFGQPLRALASPSTAVQPQPHSSQQQQPASSSAQAMTGGRLDSAQDEHEHLQLQEEDDEDEDEHHDEDEDLRYGEGKRQQQQSLHAADTCERHDTELNE